MIRSILFMAAVLSSSFPSIAAAQDVVGVNGAPCAFTTVAAAVTAAAADPNGTDVWLKSGHTFNEGGISLPFGLDLRTGDANCQPPTSTPTLAVIDGGGTLDPLFVGLQEIVHIENVVIKSHQGLVSGNLTVEGEAELVNVRILDGWSINDGGGIRVGQLGKVTISDGEGQSSISQNYAQGDGGGIFVDAGGEVALLDSTIMSYNNALFLGGGAAVKGTLDVRDTVGIFENDGSHGGGIAVTGGELDVWCDGCTIGFNEASHYGGGVTGLGSVSGQISILGALVHQNHAGLQGGGVFSGGATLYLGGNAITSNTSAGNGGGVSISTAGTHFLLDNQIWSNSAESGGGVDILADSDTLLLGNDIFGNQATTGNGGGILVRLDGSADLQANVIRQNLAAGDGGGMYLQNDADVTSENDHYHSNAAAGDGGGIMVDSGAGTPQLVLTSRWATLEGCEGWLGSGIPDTDEYCSEVRGNSATHGGGLYARGGTVTIQKTAFVANDASADAHAIGLTDVEGPVATLENTLIVEHSGASSSESVVLVEDGTQLDATHATVANNSGIPVSFEAGAAGSFVNSIVWNTLPFEIAAPNSIDGTCSNFSALGGGGLVPGLLPATSPGFAITGRGHYRLDTSTCPGGPGCSAMLDRCPSGLDDDIDDVVRAVDIWNVPGPVSTTQYDVGAFEMP